MKKGDDLTVKDIITLLLFAFIGWVACGSTMGIGMALTSLDTTLILHAIGAPIYFVILSFFYFRRFHHTKPIITAAAFLGFVVMLDFFLVALVINRSLDMFRSFLGTWLPFALIFIATWVTGEIVTRGELASPSSKNSSDRESKSDI
ncbi:MAG: hypothetical protein R6X07_13795 [Desulfatiglandales bacterium]